MAKADMEERLKAVILCIEGGRTERDVSELFDVSDRTIRRWKRTYKRDGSRGLAPKPTAPKTVKHAMHRSLRERIIRLKQKHPTWGARRLKYQYNIPVSWRSVHTVIKTSGLLVRIKPKPQPCRRFQRKHVDSLWQGDTFQFRIKGVGKVYVTGFTDDCSRYRIKSKAYLHKGKEESINALSWAVRAGRIPRQIYLDNGKQFIAKDFKKEAEKYGIRLIFGKPYNPRGRGKIESYHKALYRELVSAKTFRSLGHFRRELWKFDRRWNLWRKHEVHGWLTPADVYNDQRYFNRKSKRRG